jgi:hypothetical protein
VNDSLYEFSQFFVRRVNVSALQFAVVLDLRLGATSSECQNSAVFEEESDHLTAAAHRQNRLLIRLLSVVARCSQVTNVLRNKCQKMTRVKCRTRTLILNRPAASKYLPPFLM